MPIREYSAVDAEKSCPHCRDRFEVLETADADVTTRCPMCNHPVRRQFSSPAIGASQTGADDRAKNAGFTKLRRISKGEYEREY